MRIPSLLLLLGLLGVPGCADPLTETANAKSGEQPAATPASVTPAGTDPATTAPGTGTPTDTATPEDDVHPHAVVDAMRTPAEGSWQPALLPPNDLTDPPARYRNAEGGACVGMSAITHGFWAARVETDYVLPIERAADVFVRNMLVFRDRNGDPVMPNEPLPELVVVDGRITNIDDTGTLVRIAEIIQNRLQPGGGKQKSPDEIRRSHEEVQQYQNRITSRSDLRRRIAEAGGRMVVGAVHFDDALTETAGHAFVLTVDREGNVFVWDPNSRMANDALGSGKLAALAFDPDPARPDDDRFAAIRYEIELPDGTKQARRFEYLFPIRTFVPREKVPASPRAS